MEAEPCKICGQADEGRGLLRCCEEACTMVAHPDCLPPQAKQGARTSVQDWRCLGCRTKSKAAFLRDRDSEDGLKSEGEALKKRGEFDRGKKRGGEACDSEEAIHGPKGPKKQKRNKEGVRKSESEVAGELADRPQRKEAAGKKSRPFELRKRTKGFGGKAATGGGRQGRGRVHAETPEETSSNSIPIIALDEACDVCGKEENEELILHCTAKGCEILTHTYCCGPPLETAPERDWVCPQCIAKRAKGKSQDERRRLEEGGSDGLEEKASEGEIHKSFRDNASAGKKGEGLSESGSGEEEGRRRKRTGARGASVFDWAEGPGIESAGPSKVVGDWGRCIVKEGEARGDESRCKNRRAPGKLCCQVHSEWKAESHAKVAKGKTQLPQNAGRQGIEGPSKSGDKSQVEGKTLGMKQGIPGAGTRLSGGDPSGGAAKQGASQANATAAQKLGTTKRGVAGPFVRANGVVDDGVRCTSYAGTIATGIRQCKNARVSGKLSCQMHLERGRAKTRARKNKRARDRASGSANVNSSSESDADSHTDSAVHPDATCDVCGSAGRDDVMLLCSNLRCDSRRHTFCCDPPLGEVPEGHWFCKDCPGNPEAGEKDASHEIGNAAEMEGDASQGEPKRGREAKGSGADFLREGAMLAPVPEHIYDGVRCNKTWGVRGQLSQCTRPRQERSWWCDCHGGQQKEKQKDCEAPTQGKETGRQRWPSRDRGRRNDEKGTTAKEPPEELEEAGATGTDQDFDRAGGWEVGDPSRKAVSGSPRKMAKGGARGRSSGQGSATAAGMTAQLRVGDKNGRTDAKGKQKHRGGAREGRRRLGSAPGSGGAVDDGVRCTIRVTRGEGRVEWQCRNERLPGYKVCSHHHEVFLRRDVKCRAKRGAATAGTKRKRRQRKAGGDSVDKAGSGEGKGGKTSVGCEGGVEQRGRVDGEREGALAGEASGVETDAKRRKRCAGTTTREEASGKTTSDAAGSAREAEPTERSPVSAPLPNMHKSAPKLLRAAKHVAGLALPSPPRMAEGLSPTTPASKRRSKRLSQTRGEDLAEQDCIILTRSPKAPGENSPDRERTNPTGDPTSAGEDSPGLEPILSTGALTSTKEDSPGRERTKLTGGPTTKPANFENSEAAGPGSGGSGALHKPVDKASPGGKREGNETPRVDDERVGIHETVTSVRREEAERDTGPGGAEERAPLEGGLPNLRELVAQEVRKLFAGALELWSQSGDAQRQVFGGGPAARAKVQGRTPPPEWKSGPEEGFVVGLPEERTGGSNVRAHELERDSEVRSAGGLFEKANEADPSSGNGEDADSEAEGKCTGERRGLLTQQAQQAPNPIAEAAEDRRGSNETEGPVTETASLGLQQLEVGEQDSEKAGKRAQLLEQTNPEDTLVRQKGEGAKGAAAEEAPVLPQAHGQPQPANNEFQGGRRQNTPCHSVEVFIDLEQAPKLNQDKVQHTDGASTARPAKAQCTDGPEIAAALRQPEREEAAEPERYDNSRASTPSVLPGRVPVKAEHRSTTEKSPNQEPRLSVFHHENDVEPPTPLELPHSQSADPNLGSEQLCADTKPSFERSGENQFLKDGENAGQGQLEKPCFRSEDATRAGGAQVGAGSAEQGAPGSRSFPGERRRWKDSWKKPKLDIHGLR